MKMVIRELRKLWNIQVTVIPIIIAVLEAVLKRLQREIEELEIKGQIETIQTTALLSPRILRKVRET